MTIDSLMARPEKYKTKMHEDVFELTPDIYETLATNAEGLVRKEEFIGFVYGEIYTSIRDQLVTEAIQRRDHIEIFGMTKEEFITRSYSGQMDDIAVNPYIKESLFHEAIELFIESYQLMTVDMNGHVEHSPLQEVW